MADFDDFARLPPDFSGVVRLFPLPNLVVMPGAIQPLHIFEPRYCELLEAALADDRLVAMALLAPGWEKNYDGQPPIEPVVCIGRVVSHARLANGRHNILLAGLQRARVVAQRPLAHQFRTADVELLDDLYSPTGAFLRPALQRNLIEAFRQFVPPTSPAHQQFDQLLSHQLPLGLLTDIAAFTLSLDVEVKQRLLAECDVDRRAAYLLQHVRELKNTPTIAPLTDRQPYPPEFSDN